MGFLCLWVLIGLCLAPDVTDYVVPKDDPISTRDLAQLAVGLVILWPFGLFLVFLLKLAKWMEKRYEKQVIDRDNRTQDEGE